LVMPSSRPRENDRPPAAQGKMPVPIGNIPYLWPRFRS
jgi:hypothetical protein